jgi:hypothetical protein
MKSKSDNERENIAEKLRLAVTELNEQLQRAKEAGLVAVIYAVNKPNTVIDQYTDLSVSEIYYPKNY